MIDLSRYREDIEPSKTLLEVLDQERSLRHEQWSQWKDSHANAFGDRR